MHICMWCCQADQRWLAGRLATGYAAQNIRCVQHRLQPLQSHCMLPRECKCWYEVTLRAGEGVHALMSLCKSTICQDLQGIVGVKVTR